MAKRAMVLAALWLVAILVSVPARVATTASTGSKPASSAVGQALLGGAAIALSPVGILVGCGGGGTSPSPTTRSAAVPN